MNLNGGWQASVAVFNLEAMILSLVLDDNIMHPDNIAEGYDLFTGMVIGPDNLYGEIHTGDAWVLARNHFCGENPNNMPLALVIFGDKSHLDLHGSLSTLPLTFTLSCFNEQSRNKSKFWRPLSFIPNLAHGSSSSKNSSNPHDSVQDEHDCLKVSSSSLVDIHKHGRISATVMGRPVILKVWIYFFVGDTSGSNRWLGHFNGSRKMACPYGDCVCPFHDMDSVMPQCQYITIADYYRSKSSRSSMSTNAAKKNVDKSWSKHDIDNAFIHPNLPLSDQIHGIFCMTPPERLHTTQEGLNKYIMDSLRVTIGDTGERKKLVSDIDNLHHNLHYNLKRNSERDLPVGSVRNGVLKNSLVTASERRGNLFCLLCLCHTNQICSRLEECLSLQSINCTRLFVCIKLYLGMEEWLHDHNLKREVCASRILIAETLQLIKNVFPRVDTYGEEMGQGWSLPKFHATTKFRDYMMSFGSAINFYGGVGECNYKRFVKSTSFNTQKRIQSFTSQVATRYYKGMTFEIANTHLQNRLSVGITNNEQTVSKNNGMTKMEGKYTLTIEGLEDNGIFSQYNVDNSCSLPTHLIRGIAVYAARELNIQDRFSVVDYTACKMHVDERDEIFRCSSKYAQDGQWYDWCLIKWVDSSSTSQTYPGLILGFIQVEMKYYAIFSNHQTM